MSLERVPCGFGSLALGCCPSTLLQCENCVACQNFCWNIFFANTWNSLKTSKNWVAVISQNKHSCIDRVHCCYSTWCLFLIHFNRTISFYWSYIKPPILMCSCIDLVQPSESLKIHKNIWWYLNNLINFSLNYNSVYKFQIKRKRNGLSSNYRHPVNLGTNYQVWTQSNILSLDWWNKNVSWPIQLGSLKHLWNTNYNPPYRRIYFCKQCQQEV